MDAEWSIPAPLMPIDQGGLGFEMPGKFEIMRAVRKGLNSLEVGEGKNGTVWTTVVKTELCKIGRDRFGCKVCASGVDKADFGEWLYDVTWLEYEKNDRGKLVNLVDAPLVAECEWGNKGDIEDDFEKLLLARAGVRLMIFDGNYQPGSKEIAERLAGGGREFNGSRAEDAWLLAAWEKIDSATPNDWWRFRYFTIEMNAAIRELI